MASIAASVTRIRSHPTRTLRASAEAFLDTLGPGNPRRAYGIAVVKTVDQLDGRGLDGLSSPSRALESVSDDETGRSPRNPVGRSGGQYVERAPRRGREMAFLVA
ncbi:hypothetical protein KO481_40700 [Nocardia sp. NEAU-G5]|uniref:Uncharacterized protein n=1 Tax=Nocardia albiluteola TaxID=2842303 RepID=A0ABS6BC04_9NOCA|nr:hypothetical protein [Nocardia albiluteola]MBU3067822.1 hypothetical protein [Nocardia albiluteola]